MWQVIAASSRGTSHVQIGSPCQDAYGYRILENCVIATVADGLSSAKKSDEGAKLAVDTIIDVLKNALAVNHPIHSESWKQILASAFNHTRERLEQTAKITGIPLQEYDTTLLVVVITPNWLTVGHVGDGAVVALMENEILETISPPQRGEYANEVTPLTDQKALDAVRFYVRSIPVKAVALLSDGLQSLSINLATGTPYKPFFAPLFESLCQPIDTAETSLQLAEFLNSERICLKTDDDKTLLVVGKI